MTGRLESLTKKASQISGYQRYLRHLQSLGRHATPRKVRNLIQVELEYRRRATRLHGRPYKIIIDTCNVCNMGCPMCPNGMKELRRPRRMMTLETFGKVIDEIRPWAIEVSLHNWGEPLLNPDIYKMIAAARDADIGTTMSSTLSTASREDMDRIIRSGLEYLVVSMNGTNPETYNAYIPGGDFNKVTDNLRTLIRRRRELGSRTPFIEWQFLVLRPNEREMPEAARMAWEFGVDQLRFASAGLPMGHFHNHALAAAWMPLNRKYWRFNTQKLVNQPYLLDQHCFYLYRSITVNPDGKVSPCCAVYDEKFDFGDLLEDGLEGLWNNERFRSARASFADRSETGLTPTVCMTCMAFRHP